MFSFPALLIVFGLGLLALFCSIFPVAPTSRLAGLFLLASILAAFLTPIIGLAIGAGVFGLFLVDAIISSGKTDVKRTMPTQLARGVPSPFRIAAKNKAEKSIAGTGSIDVMIRQPRCADVFLSRKESINDLSGTLTATRRGLHKVPPFATRYVGPLGLAMWHRPFDEEHEIKVFPDLPAAYQLAHSIQQGRFATAGLKRRGPLGLGTNFESVREYFPDDDIRNVNWKTTARMGKPMTNQYRVEQDRDVVVLIDTGRLMIAPLPLDKEIENDDEYLEEEYEEEKTTISATRLDIALDAVCGLVSVADVMGDRSGVIAFNSSVRKHLTPRRAGARAIIRTIYDLEPIPVDSDFDAAINRIGKSKRSFVLILTDFMDPQSAKPLARALRTIIKKHRVVVSGVVDPDVKKLLESDDEYLKFAANEMQKASLQAVDLIKKAGAEVVYCEHEDFMLECVKTYLAAKQRAAF